MQLEPISYIYACCTQSFPACCGTCVYEMYGWKPISKNWALRGFAWLSLPSLGLAWLLLTSYVLSSTSLTSLASLTSLRFDFFDFSAIFDFFAFLGFFGSFDFFVFLNFDFSVLPSLPGACLPGLRTGSAWPLRLASDFLRLTCRCP